MSTRATYQFIGNPEELEPTVTVYVHYDGYPSGAAEYFQAALKQKRGCLATKFMHAVKDAELTHSHEAHDDTEFRYDIKNNHVTAFENDGNDTWVIFFEGDLTDFIEQYKDQTHEVTA